MKVLSLIEPWASLMALNVKRNETRSWHTDYRGDLAIAASDRKVRPVLKGCSEQMIAPCFEALRDGYGLPDEPGAVWDYMDQNTIGRILCVVRVIGMEQSPRHRYVPEQEALFGDYSPGRWIWITDNCRRLPRPIKFKGAQGIRELDPGIVGAIRRQIL